MLRRIEPVRFLGRPLPFTRRAVAAALLALPILVLGSCTPRAQNAAGTGVGTGTFPATSSRCPHSAHHVIQVRNAAQLHAALAGVGPGDTVELAAGVYRGQFADTRSGTAGSPITICGSRTAILDGGSVNDGYTLYLDHANYTDVIGISVRDGLKGIVADHWMHGLVDGVAVTHVGQEAIHLREYSSHDVIAHSVVSGTGLSDEPNSIHYGEGIYVGSAYENWQTYTGGHPDRCNDNQIVDNNISHTTAESIDIKEGTTGGLVHGNHLDGIGMRNPTGADSLIDVKGNRWVVTGNVGVRTPQDGFEVTVKLPGWGRGTEFADNVLSVPSRGYGINVDGSHTGTVIACSNRVRGAQLSNLRTRCG